MFKDAVVCYFMSYLLSLLFMIYEKKESFNNALK